MRTRAWTWWVRCGPGEAAAWSAPPGPGCYGCIKRPISLRMSGGRACHDLSKLMLRATQRIPIRSRRCWLLLVLSGLVPSLERDFFARGAPARLDPGELGLLGFLGGLPRYLCLHRFPFVFEDTDGVLLSPRCSTLATRAFPAGAFRIGLLGWLDDCRVQIDPLSFAGKPLT